MLAPRPYQREAIDAVHAAHRRGMVRPATVMFTGAGKGHPLDTVVPTPRGMRLWGDLAVGDQVYGVNGLPTRVTAIFDRGVLPTYEVTLSDGASVQVDGDHLWAVRTKFDKRAGLGYRTLSTLEIARRGDVDWFIPMSERVVGEQADLPIDPYLLGVLLGDGGLSVDGRVLLTCRNDTAELAREALPAGVTMTHVADAGRDCQTWIIGAGTGRGDNPVMTALRDMGLMGATAWHKFVPDQYRAASARQRLALIQGLCDTDGYVGLGKTAVEYTTVSELLADDVAEIVNSLGGRAKIVRKQTTWTHLGERRFSTAYRMHIRLPAGLRPVRVGRKVAALGTATKYDLTRRIVSVRRVDDAEIRCITVAAEDQLYLITRSHIVTHNTVVFSHLAVEWLADNPGRRVLILVHTQELLDQAIAKLRSVAPGLSVGAVQADRNETLARVIVATVQTLRSENRRRMIRNVGLIIVDECHHAVANTYRSVLGHFGALGTAPGDEIRAVAAGYTATMVRADDLALGDVWQDVVYTRTITEGIADGSLVRPRGIHVQVDDLDLSQVRTSRGDYREGDLGEAIENSLAPTAIAKAVAEHAASRKILLFAPTVHSAGVIADALTASGRPTGLVHGGLGNRERRAVLDAFRAGETPILANCMVLTEGFDEPAADCLVLARPTKSLGLYIQMAGRVLRPWPGKTDALILDVVGATRHHALVSGIELFGEKAPKAPKDPDELVEVDGEFDAEGDLDEGQQDARRVLGAADGPLVATEVDLFAGSAMAWLRTRAGVFFLPAGDRYIAILPGAPRTEAQWMAAFDGRDYGFTGYDVVTMHKDQLHTERAIVSGVEDLAYAMAWAEGDVTPTERTVAARERSWRARVPSARMTAFAERLRLPVSPHAKAGEVSNMITLALGTRRIDGHLPAYLRRR